MIRSLSFVNAGPYRGEHVVELGTKAYAITARYESDPGRSNMGGKSFFLEMIDFAITGKLAKFRRFDADGWITRGEREGKVRLDLEDGYWISRERKRGQATQLKFGGPGLGKGATQADAAEMILKHLGFNEEDFRNVAYFEQKHMARLVLAQPEDRMAVVRGWFGLAKCDQAEERVGDIATESANELEKLRAQREALVAMMGDKPEAFDHEEARKREAALQQELKQLRADYQAAIDVAAQARDHHKIVSEYDELVVRGKALAAEVTKAMVDELLAKAEAAKQVYDVKHGAFVDAQRDARAKHKVSLGQFDGRCPVASIECPATKQINSDRAASKAAYDEAKRLEAAAIAAFEVAAKEHELAYRNWKAADDKLANLKAMRAKASVAVEQVESARAWLQDYVPIDVSRTIDAQREEVEGRLSYVRSSVTLARAREEKWDEQQNRLIQLDDAIEREQHDFSIASRTRSVFRATQRRVAERALGAINRQASSMLSDGGIDLAVELRWERDGKDPAKQCEDCGAAFPKSATVKICARCGATRGKQVVQKLEFLPSDRSGAADDIAGVVLQLAAGAWFLRSRKSPWATAMLDEPLGSCDRTNRRALSMQLVKLLSTGVWRQALLISHSPDTVDLYPGRIEIVIGKDGSRRIVQEG